MSRGQKIFPSPPSHSVLTWMLLLVALLGMMVSVCGPPQVKKISGVYVVSQNGLLEAFHPENGSLHWQQQLDTRLSQNDSLTVFNNVLYVGRTDFLCSVNCPASSNGTGSLYAVNASNGKVLWHIRLEVHHTSFSVMGVSNGIVYVGVGDALSNGAGSVDALRESSGALLWQYTTRGICCRGLGMVGTTVYLGEWEVGGGGQVSALQAKDGSLLWQQRIDRPNALLDVVAADDVILVSIALFDKKGSLPDGAVEARRGSSGSLLWRHLGSFGTAVLTGADGIVYVGGTLSGSLDALRAADGSLLWHSQNQARSSFYQASVMDGVVYLTSACIYCSHDTGGTAVDALQESSGSHLWSYQDAPRSANDLQSLEIAVGGGTVYVFAGTLHGIVALDATTGNKRWFHAINGFFTLAVG